TGSVEVAVTSSPAFELVNETERLWLGSKMLLLSSAPQVMLRSPVTCGNTGRPKNSGKLPSGRLASLTRVLSPTWAVGTSSVTVTVKVLLEGSPSESVAV